MAKLPVSWFDRALLSLAPEYGLKRIRARATLDLLQKRHYEAAIPGRRTDNWQRNFHDADVTLRSAAATLRNHSRDLMRNNGWAKRARAVVSNNTVGRGIRPKAVGADPTVLAAAMDLWKRWGETVECESDNRQTFYGIQRLVMRNLMTDGEVLIRRRWRRAADGLSIPIQLQVIEADYINTAWNALNSDSGGPIIQGIEFDKLGRRAAYWLFQNHPGSGRNIDPPKRIAAEEIIHVYDVERAGQTRGVSWLGAAIVNLKELDEYDDAELMKQKIAACFAAFVTDTDGLGSPIGEPTTGDDSIETFEPGMIHQLPPGKSVTMANPPTLTSDALPARTLRRVAASLGITFEDLTGDYSGVNFSSARMARIAHWGNVQAWQQDMVIPLVCTGVWDWAMEAAVDFGLLPVAPTSSWTPPPMPALEPDKEALALQRSVRAGAKTFSDMVREQGDDPDTHFAEYAADLARLDALKIVLDSDARKTTQVGQEQPSETAEKAPPEPDPAPVAADRKAVDSVLAALNLWTEQQRTRNKPEST